MTVGQIALHSLRRRKGRATFLLLGLLIGVASVVAFLSLVETLSNDITHKLELYGANIVVVPRTEDLAINYGGLSLGGVSFEMQELNQKDLERIRTIKNRRNIAAVGPMALGAVEVNGQRLLLAGVEMEATRFLRPWWKVSGELPGEEGVLLGAEAARVLGLQVGSRLGIRGREMPVSGILEPAGSQDDQMVFAHLQTAQAVLRKEGRISMAEIAALCADCPVDEIVSQVSEVLPAAKVMAIKQVVQGRMETLGHLRKFAYGLSAVMILVGGLVVLVTMMGSVRERTAEIGVFRAVGFRRSHVIRMVLLEAGIVSALAGTLGYLLGMGGTRTAIPLFAEGHHVSVPLDPAMAAGAVLAAVFLGLLSSVYPALTAARLDPSEALRAL